MNPNDDSEELEPEREEPPVGETCRFCGCVGAWTRLHSDLFVCEDCWDDRLTATA